MGVALDLSTLQCTEVVLLEVDDEAPSDDSGWSEKLYPGIVAINIGHSAQAPDVSEVAQVTVTGGVVGTAVHALGRRNIIYRYLKSQVLAANAYVGDGVVIGSIVLTVV